MRFVVHFKSQEVRLRCLLLEIGREGPRLVLTADAGLQGLEVRYITLSHRWNRLCMPRLTSKTIRSFKERIDMVEWPTSFTNALEMTK
jgi:hypothetical protein